MPQNTAQRAFWAKKRKSGTKNASKGKRQKSAKEKLAEVERDDPIEDASETDEGSPAAKRARWGTPEPSIADLESSIEDKSEKVCMSAWCQHGRVGFAYYDPIKCVVFVLEDAEETAHYDLTQMVLDHASPDIIFTCSRADERFIELLQKHVETTQILFQIRPWKEFLPQKGKDRILSLSLLSDLIPSTDIRMEEGSSHSGSSDIHARNAHDFMMSRRRDAEDPTTRRWKAEVRAANYTPLDSAPLCTGSIGSLLDHLVKQRAVEDLDNDGIRGLDVRAIESLSLDQVMHINADALNSLQIFENESHASVHSNKTKEGLSLFGIINTTKTSLGKALLRTWFLRPSLSLDVIKARHDTIDCFNRTDNQMSVNELNGHLQGIKNVPRMLGILKSGRGKATDWQGLVKFTFHCAMIKDALHDLNEAGSIPIVSELLRALDVGNFRDIGNRINDTIDWEESSEAGRVCVQAGIDEELDNRKHVYYGIDSVLSKVAERICQSVPPAYASKLNIVYFPQLGFLICIPMRPEWENNPRIQVEGLDGWSFQFSTDSHIYFKSLEMQDMDTHIGDLHSVIVDREIEIVQALLDEILPYEASMSHACDVCAELDCLLAFSDASRAYGYTRPSMTEENVLEFEKGRHPLQELVVDTFVANDFCISDGDGDAWNNVVVCTGANACGKSVLLKQVAIIQYMAQIGCFVPAESARLGLVDKIFTRVSTRESVSKVQSAFMIDLNQVSLAIRNCTARSLVLLDEFGKGTAATDGAGLLCGVLKHLLDREEGCPKVLAATHFHDIFREEVIESYASRMTFLHMQVMFTAVNGEHVEEVRGTEKITFLYRVAEGLSLDSQAAQCAEIYGVPARIVDRARYVSALNSSHNIGALLDEEMTDAEKLDLEDAEAVCRRFLAWNLNESEDGLDVKAKLAEVLGLPNT